MVSEFFMSIGGEQVTAASTFEVTDPAGATSAPRTGPLAVTTSTMWINAHPYLLPNLSFGGVKCTDTHATYHYLVPGSPWGRAGPPLEELAMDPAANERYSIHVDRSRCEGVGVCELQAPDYFEVHEDGTFVVGDEVLAKDLDAVHGSVESCPNKALRLLDAADLGTGADGGVIR